VVETISRAAVTAKYWKAFVPVKAKHHGNNTLPVFGRDGSPADCLNHRNRKEDFLRSSFRHYSEYAVGTYSGDHSLDIHAEFHLRGLQSWLVWGTVFPA
jgi:hypothetical protein